MNVEEKRLKSQITKFWDRYDLTLDASMLGVGSGMIGMATQKEKKLSGAISAAFGIGGIAAGIYGNIKLKKLSEKLKKIQLENNTYKSEEWGKGYWFPKSRRTELDLSKHIFNLPSRKKTKRRKRSIALSAAGNIDESVFIKQGGNFLGINKSEVSRIKKGEFPKGKRGLLLKGGQLALQNKKFVKSNLKKINPEAFQTKRRISQKIARYVKYIDKRKSYIKHVKRHSTKQKRDIFRKSFSSICNEFKHY